MAVNGCVRRTTVSPVARLTRGQFELFADRISVFESQPWTTVALPSLLSGRIDVHGRRSAERNRVDTKYLGGQVFPHVAVQSLDDRHHDNQEHDAHDHTEEAEERLQLLSANLMERQGDSLPEVH